MTRNSNISSKDWIDLARYSKPYIDGVESFLDFAYSYGDPQGQEIQCPCAKCCNIRWTRRNVVYDHLICYGFVKGYTRWINHGEWDIKLNVDDDMDYSRDDIDGLLNDQFRDVAQAEGVYDGPNENAKKYYNLFKEASQELYPGCTGFSKLSFTLRLYLLKCLHGWSNESFTSLLELLKEVMPELNILPSYNKTKSMVKNLGIDYEKIDACPNDCMLFRNDHKDDEFCHTCRSSRYIKNPKVDSEVEPSKKSHRVSAKTLRHFPLIPRLKRLFMCSKTANSLRWHDEKRSKDGKLRHPADGQAWKDFDRLHPIFAQDSRNVRLGLASDGFNPFRTMSISHSTWPFMLMAYNLPPWMCMKSEYSILSLLIPGPRSPGNDIDIYLQPLIDELKLLWDSGVETYDASRNQTFQMRAALMWTINDFPTYAMLFGWSTKGKFACPCCNYNTNSHYFKHSQKMCYMDHRVFLPMDHPWTSNKRSFNGKTDFRPPPPLLKGIDHNLLRHSLDVMHIEKNIVDSILGTLLDIPGKTKDHAKARYDLKEMGIRKNLHPKDTEDNKRTKFAKACFSMTNGEKSVFCGVLKTAKLPDGSASNISRAVQTRFNRRARNNDECDPSDAETVSLFPKKGCPLGAKKTDPVSLDNKSLSQAHAYLLGNCDEIQEYIRGPNFVAKRYSGYLINGYRFHIRQRDARHKTQNSGVTVVASTTSFARSKDKNPIATDLTYYGRIVDIVELDYYSHFKVVLFKCDWYEVEKDIYGLTYVYFNKRCSQEEPFVLASQVHQCFYVQDPYDQDRH
ncbi:hypothetical protein MTR67_011552 [Solanum verrucosum]|uniref:Transposase-associated domain-containing protein n=1 Tax=Solanum verrucosum TaxID=315347 RepID=A0AAF0Q890_SOLVR|nr:hypothetical protein MTR67_011552 [Solanum verrucosum]